MNFITGKPGGGKGLLAMQKLVEELVHGDRPIITNLAVKFDPWVFNGEGQVGLRFYLRKKYKLDLDLEKRIWLLSDDQVREFYLYRMDKEGNKIKLRENRDEKGRVIDFETADALKAGGVVYCCDEAWKFWGSRHWANTAQGTEFYLAQHRKFGDDVLIVTQAVKQIDVAFARLAQDFTVMRNHGKERLSIFRQPSMFTAKTFIDYNLNQCTDTRHFTLDKKGLAQCYDTSAGVGLMGGTPADVNARHRGISLWWLFAAIAVFVVALMSLPRVMGSMFSHTYGRALDLRTAGKYVTGIDLQATNSPLSRPGSAQPLGTAPLSQIPVFANRPTNAEPAVFCTGYSSVGGNKWCVFLSDGQEIWSDSGRIQGVFQYGVRVDGNIYRMAPVGWRKKELPHEP